MNQWNTSTHSSVSSILTRLARTVKMAASVAPKLSMTRVGLSGLAAARRVTQSTRCTQLLTGTLR